VSVVCTAALTHATLRFYSYHYAPLIADLVALDAIEIKFELGQPFLPYEQVRGVCCVRLCLYVLPDVITLTRSRTASRRPATRVGTVFADTLRGADDK
jgi:hypothetical protein